jgi:hypothetical protein
MCGGRRSVEQLGRKRLVRDGKATHDRDCLVLTVLDGLDGSPDVGPFGAGRRGR